MGLCFGLVVRHIIKALKRYNVGRSRLALSPSKPRKDFERPDRPLQVLWVPSCPGMLESRVFFKVGETSLQKVELRTQASEGIIGFLK